MGGTQPCPVTSLYGDWDDLLISSDMRCSFLGHRKHAPGCCVKLGRVDGMQVKTSIYIHSGLEYTDRATDFLSRFLLGVAETMFGPGIPLVSNDSSLT